MSSHSVKAHHHHAQTGKGYEHFDIDLMRFELCDHRDNGVTYCLRVQSDPLAPRIPPPLFSGHVERGMADQLRALADRLDELEDRL